MEKILPSKEYLHMSYYDEEAKTSELPKGNECDFLLERNTPYMNYNALIFGDRKISYEEFHTRIDEYARALYKRGIRENDKVAFASANVPEGIITSYALKKLGAIVAPVNPLANAYKMRKDLEILNPKWYIGINESMPTYRKSSKDMNIDAIQFPLFDSISDKKLKTLYTIRHILSLNMPLDRKKHLLKIVEDGKDYEAVVYPEYKKGTVSSIMFTGGSSGVHKGTELDSNGLNCVVRSLDWVLNLNPGDKFMGNLPAMMAFGQLAMHYALCKSLSVELTLKAMPKDFVSELYRIKPDGVFGGPVQWEALFNHVIARLNDSNIKSISSEDSNLTLEEVVAVLGEMIKKANLKDLYLSWLKLGVSGGEQLKQFTERVGNVILKALGYNDELWNGLGMTEMWAPVSVKRGKINSIGTIGTTIPFNNQKIVDHNTFEELGYGEIGLLLVTGPGMMLGYHNNEEETNKVIYVDEEKTRWLNTGDLCILHDNGELEYIERLKRSFVCGVENVYPQQIENMLTQIPEIREVIVTKIPDAHSQFYPKYHISLRDTECDITKLIAKITKLITSTLGQSFMAKYFEFYDVELPRTANGKIDHKPLQEKDDDLLKNNGLENIMYNFKEDTNKKVRRK